MTTDKVPHTGISQLTWITDADAMEAPQADAMSDMVVSSNGYRRGQTISGTIHIERLIWHITDHLSGVFRCGEPTRYGHDTENLFADHIRKVIEESQWDACFVEEDGSIADQCRQLLGATEEEFLFASKLLAKRLYDSMMERRVRKTITRGDFVAAIYRHDEEELRRIAIFKLDMETRQVRAVDHTDEKTHIEIREDDGVLPTPKDRKFTKAALLTPINVTNKDGTVSVRFQIRLLDEQAGPRSHGVAFFFYEGFLDATLMPNSRRHTHEFLRVTDEFISQQDGAITQDGTISSEDRERFYDARREALSAALLNSDDPQVNIDQFVEAALPNHPGLQDQLASDLARTVLPISTSFESVPRHFSIDAGVARPFVHKVTLVLDRGVRLVFPSLDAYKKMVEFDKDDHENMHRIVIKTHNYRQVER